MTTTPRRSRQEPTTLQGANHTGWRMLLGAARILARVAQGLLASVALVALVVGLPWALWHFIGWPLPTHVPTWAEVETVLLGPMTATFLLDFLACVCWILWLAFVIDVARCAVQVTRDGLRTAQWPTVSAARPVHAVAAVLISAVALSILGNRSAPPPTSSPSSALGPGSTVVATAPAWSSTPDMSNVAVQRAVFATHQATSVSQGVTTRPQSVVVRARDPETGVYDSLSRISERTLGTQARWPEIFERNKGKPQPNGKTFTNPHLIFPGEELLLPVDATVAPVPLPGQPPQPQQPPPSPSTPTPTTPPQTSAPARPAAPAPSTPPAPPTTASQPPPASREPATGWGPELFVGLGLAAAVSTALIVARRRHRRGYQPGSARRDDLDLPVAPAVYQLHLAHLRTEHDDELDLDDDTTADQPAAPAAPPTVIVGAADPGTSSSKSGRSSFAPEVGVRDGRAIALDLAVARGLGLIGAGCPAAARALLLAVLTATTDITTNQATPAGASVIVPADDLPLLLGHGTARAHLPHAVRVAPSLEAALDELEADILVRAHDDSIGSQPRPSVVLVARPPEHNSQRLQAVLDNGAPFGVLGVLLGHWRAGITAYIREDGTVSATSPGQGEALRGTRMFRVGSDQATALLDLMRRAQPETPWPDHVLPSDKPQPRSAGAEPGGDDAFPQDAPTGGVTDHGVVANDAMQAADTELEVTAVANAVEQPGDTNLEIIETHTVPPPGARLRPAAIVEQQPASVATADQGDETPVAGGARGTTAGEPGHASRTAAGEDGSAVPIRITVLGQPRVYWRPGPEGEEHEVTGAFQPRLRELLVFLGLHPDGATRESLVAALWADSPPDKTTNAMNTALSRLRTALGKATDGALADIAVVGQGRYRLDLALVDVDYWRFDRATAVRRAAASPQDRIDAYREVVNSYTGPLADGMSTEWIESAREAIRRDAIDAVAALARALVDQDPEQTLDLLEMARAFDPHNELLYRDIMRLQERLGRLDAIPRTLTLLATRLAEVDDQPTAQALSLAARLRQRHEAAPAAPAGPPPRGAPQQDGHSVAS